MGLRLVVYGPLHNRVYHFFRSNKIDQSPYRHKTGDLCRGPARERESEVERERQRGDERKREDQREREREKGRERTREKRIKRGREWREEERKGTREERGERKRPRERERRHERGRERERPRVEKGGHDEGRVRGVRQGTLGALGETDTGVVTTSWRVEWTRILSRVRKGSSKTSPGLERGYPGLLQYTGYGVSHDRIPPTDK